MYKSALASVWVCVLVKKRLERGWRKTPNVRKSMAQCSVKRSRSLSFPNASLMGFRGKQRSFLLTSRPCLLSPPSSPSSPAFFLPTSSPLFFLATFLSFSILLLSLPASLSPLPPWLFCSIAKWVLHQWLWNQQTSLNGLANMLF